MLKVVAADADAVASRVYRGAAAGAAAALVPPRTPPWACSSCSRDAPFRLYSAKNILLEDPIFWVYI